MRIPSKTKTPRFYVAMNLDWARSSWRSQEEAELALRRFLVVAPFPPLGVVVVGPEGRTVQPLVLQGWTDYPMLESEKGDHARDPAVPRTQAPWRRATVLAYDRNKYADVEVEGFGLLNFKVGYVLCEPSWETGMPFSSGSKKNLPFPSDSVPCLG